MVRYEIRYNKRNKRHIVFEVPDKGLWKIKKSFETKKEASEWVKDKSKKKVKKTKKGRKAKKRG